MSFRRSLSVWSLLRGHSYRPSRICAVLHDDDENYEGKCFLQAPTHRGHNGSSPRKFCSNSAFSCSPLSQSLRTPLGSALYRSFSTSHGVGSDEPNGNDMAEDLTKFYDMVYSIVGPVCDTFPVAAAQNLIEMVHSFTGFNWWASIVLTTLLIRGFMIPFMIDNLRNYSCAAMVTICSPSSFVFKELYQGWDSATFLESVRRAKILAEKLCSPEGVTVLRLCYVPFQLLIQPAAIVSIVLAYVKECIFLHKRWRVLVH